VSVRIDAFYDHDALTDRLTRLRAAAPDLLSLSSLATTPEGREVWCATVADERGDRPLSHRPALLVTANLHASELAGSWAALHLLRHCVRERDDPAVRRLIRERKLYVVPRVAADAADRVLDIRGRIARSRYVDPSRVDEPDVVHQGDVNGDGRVLRMRWEAPDGDHVLAEDGRLVVPRRPGDEGPAYRTAIEGTVPDYAGGPVGDAPTRNDFNRNFPTGAWRPFDWVGHGRYPLSEPETRALAEFCYDHPEIVGNVDLHTGNPAVFYPHGAAPPADHADDADLIREIGERAAAITGFPLLWGYGEARGEDEPTPLPGAFKDFCYERLGIPAVLLELGLLYNYLGLDTASLDDPDAELARRRGRAMLDYHDGNDRTAFHEWEPYDHPQLGEVEIGGWDDVARSNPPVREMDDVATRVTEAVLAVAEWRPDVRIAALDAASVDANADGRRLYRVRATLVNRGRLSTGITEQAAATHLRARPRVRVALADGGVGDDDDDLEAVSGPLRRRIDHLDAGDGSTTLEWVLRAPPATLELTVTSPRGVYATGRVEL